MKQVLRTLLLATLFILAESPWSFGQKNIEIQLSDSLTAIANNYTYVGRINVTNFSPNPNSATVFLSFHEKMLNMPFRPDNVARIYNAIRKILPEKYADYSLNCQIGNKNIEDYIPNFYRIENIDTRKQFRVMPLSQPLVTNASRPFDIISGLKNRHIALWQSHGLYYDQKQMRWSWQRARVFQVVEDLYTQSYVLPYLVPMLENAGANVLLPRERDTQTHEVIVDEDVKDESRYRESNERKSWETGGIGFANAKKFYIQGENPFAMGTFRKAETITDADETSLAEWFPNIPESGRYAVYVSYKTVENSTTDAHYTVIHRGIKTEFHVNQNLNGGTWLYLGHFYFDKGKYNQNKVVLSNLSSDYGKIVTADAVKFGGGMGNIARSPRVVEPAVVPQDTVKLPTLLPKIVYEPDISHYPRFAEGARYWLQWAGISDSIYCRTKGQNDYSDDFQSRGFWVNYLVGGSSVSPANKGLAVPVDLALAFHSDAGVTPNDSIIGTLGICSVQNSQGKTVFENGVSRWASADLSDIIQTQIVNDVRKQFAPEWTRRGMWNKSYSESRVPEVPTMLLELLSHQNFADMRYGLDPRFRFTVSRSIYKGMLKYLAAANSVDYVVQPLPVEQMSCRFVDKNKLVLRWAATIDSLEITAQPNRYVVYTRIDGGDFDNGVVVDADSAVLTVQSGKIYSYKVTAVNKGGESFPSEILSASRALNEKGEVLIVNSFERLSAPASFQFDSIYSGFLNDIDPGVPYISEISFVGKQYEFQRNKPWENDDAPGFGASHANFEAKEIAGNTFDYPYLHGKAIKEAGYSFVSSSVKSVLRGSANMNNYKVVDLIFGKQKQTFVGNAKKAPEFKTFPLALQQFIQTYCNNGGNLFLSGAYIGSDLCEGSMANKNDRLFLENTLKCKFRTSQASVSGSVKMVSSPLKAFKMADFSYYDQPNKVSYYVQSSDAIEPVGEESTTICRYAENSKSAAVAYAGKYKTCVFGFPFEAIQTEKDRAKLMESVLNFFLPNSDKSEPKGNAIPIANGSK